MIDLHCHSYFSDGELSPIDLLNKAVEAKLSVLALTDHDTISGLAPLQSAALAHEIKIINGIELSVRWKKYDIHIIGLNIQPDHPYLCSLMTQQSQSRITRAHQIANRLLEYGIEDAYVKACELAGHERVGRPHFAQLLINEGIVGDMKSAFKRFLGYRCVAYVPTAWVDIDTAVAGIVKSGGQAVIAHPLKYALTRSKLHELIIAFKMAGGVGIEVISGEMSQAQVNEACDLCRRFELLASTGSDYHGDSMSRIALGQQRSLPVNCTPIWNQWNI